MACASNAFVDALTLRLTTSHNFTDGSRRVYEGGIGRRGLLVARECSPAERRDMVSKAAREARIMCILRVTVFGLMAGPSAPKTELFVSDELFTLLRTANHRARLVKVAALAKDAWEGRSAGSWHKTPKALSVAQWRH